MPFAVRENNDPSAILVALARKLAFAVSRLLWRIEFHNTENISEIGAGGFIVVSNHPTYFDPFWISLPIKKDLRFLAWDHAFRWPFVGGLIRRLGAIPISLEDGGTIGTLKRSIKLLEQGCGLVVFPEGEREFGNGEFLPFKTGAAQLAIRTGVPILPVSVAGGSRVWPRGKFLPGPGKVDVYFHPLFRIGDTEKTKDQKEFLSEKTEALRRIIAAPLDNFD